MPPITIPSNAIYASVPRKLADQTYSGPAAQLPGSPFTAGSSVQGEITPPTTSQLQGPNQMPVPPEIGEVTQQASSWWHKLPSGVRLGIEVLGAGLALFLLVRGGKALPGAAQNIKRRLAPTPLDSKDLKETKYNLHDTRSKTNTLKQIQIALGDEKSIMQEGRKADTTNFDNHIRAELEGSKGWLGGVFNPIRGLWMRHASQREDLKANRERISTAHTETKATELELAKVNLELERAARAQHNAHIDLIKEATQAQITRREQALTKAKRTLANFETNAESILRAHHGKGEGFFRGELDALVRSKKITTEQRQEMLEFYRANKETFSRKGVEAAKKLLQVKVANAELRHIQSQEIAREAAGLDYSKHLYTTKKGMTVGQNLDTRQLSQGSHGYQTDEDVRNATASVSRDRHSGRLGYGSIGPIKLKEDRILRSQANDSHQYAPVNPGFWGLGRSWSDYGLIPNVYPPNSAYSGNTPITIADLHHLANNPVSGAIR